MFKNDRIANPPSPSYLTAQDAAANLMKFANEGRLVRSHWHTSYGGRENACLLGSLHAGINSPSDCPSHIMPSWLASALVPNFDRLPDNNTANTYGRELAIRMTRWSVLSNSDWTFIRNALSGYDCTGKQYFDVLLRALDQRLPAMVRQNFAFDVTFPQSQRVNVVATNLVDARSEVQARYPNATITNVSRPALSDRPYAVVKLFFGRGSTNSWNTDFDAAVRASQAYAQARGLRLDYIGNSVKMGEILRQFWGINPNDYAAIPSSVFDVYLNAKLGREGSGKVAFKDYDHYGSSLRPAIDATKSNAYSTGRAFDDRIPPDARTVRTSEVLPRMFAYWGLKNRVFGGAMDNGREIF